MPIEGFTLLSYASVIDPFRIANLLTGQNLYDVMTIGKVDSAVPSSGLAVATLSHYMSKKLSLDYLFVIAGGRPEDFSDQKTLNLIAHYFRRGTRICGVSGGPVILAKAGILNGHRFTVHWEHAPALLEKHPDLLLERTLFTVDRSLTTCGGGSAVLDMTLFLIERDHGPELVRRVSDWCLHTVIREVSLAQRKAGFKNIGPSNIAVHRIVAKMEENIASPLPLLELIKTEDLSSRQLNRVFKRATGESVMQYYRNMRLEFATNLIRTTTLSITQIAQATGFSSSSHFSTAYQARYKIIPSALRA